MGAARPEAQAGPARYGGRAAGAPHGRRPRGERAGGARSREGYERRKRLAQSLDWVLDLERGRHHATGQNDKVVAGAA
jgi:hypothetical protein